jgi:hypothetical protein
MMIYSFIHNFTVQPQKYVDPHDVIVTYISNIDYFHPFMLCLYGAYLLFILAMIKFRRSTMMQVLGFVSCAFSLQSIDIINTYLHKTVGQTWYTENPFLEDVLFTKLTVGLPATVLLVGITFNMLIQSVCRMRGRGRISHAKKTE